MKVLGYVAVAFFVLLAFWAYMEYFYTPAQTITVKNRRNYDVVIFRLPTTPNTDIFGPPLWDARHFLAEFTPCPSCRADAVSHEKFFHDWVNKKTNKKMVYPENYKEWLCKLCGEKKS